MVKLNGKEISQEEFDKLVSDSSSVKSLAEAYERKTKELEQQVAGLGDVDKLKQELESSKQELYKRNLNDRLSKINKYLDRKGKSEDIIKRIGDMSDSDFEFFAEGKTNDEFKTKEEIESAKTDLETQKIDLETNKDKIIKDALRGFEDSNKKKNDQELVPNSEVNIDNEANGQEDGFPTNEKLMEVYNLNGNAMFDKTPEMMKNARAYLNRYGEIQQ